MRKTGKVQARQRFMEGIATLALVLLIVLFGDGFAIVSHAESQGRVTATSANIRKEPSSSSEVVGSTLKDKIITITNQVQGSDGHTWYQTFVNSETLGYIRSDLVEIIDGSTPPTGTAPGTTSPQEPPTVAGELEVLNPVSATVKGGNSVRIRSTATDSEDNIVKTVSNGLALTVTGRATDSKGKVWYQVSFSDEGADVSGFIREDYVTVEGELTPYVEPEPEPPAEDPGVTEPEPAAPSKDYDTALIDGEWYLQDFLKNEQHKISTLFDAANTNVEVYNAEHKKAETEKIVIIILVFLLVAAASGIAMLIFKIKDMSDDAYFNQVERETLRRRGETRAQGASRKVMHTVGAEKAASGKPAGAKAGGNIQGARPAGTSQGQRPAGNAQGARPAGASQGQRPGAARPGGNAQGARPSGTSSGQRPGGSPQGTRPAGAVQGQRPSGNGQRQSEGSREAKAAGGRQGASGQKPVQGWQSKNFMSEEDDEFEFGFLNYDGAEEK